MAKNSTKRAKTVEQIGVMLNDKQADVQQLKALKNCGRLVDIRGEEAIFSFSTTKRATLFWEEVFEETVLVPDWL